MINNITCKKCGHFWVSRVEHPTACPRCKRYDYNIESIKKGGIKNDKSTKTN